jgi:carbon storage regulator CsrA
VLVLSRKCTQEIVIGDRIRVRVGKVQGDVVELAVDAPPETRVVTGERDKAERLARIKADHNTVRCPACLAKTNATADGVDIHYSCRECDWRITQPAVGDTEELALERRRSLRHGPHEQMGDGMTDERPKPKGNAT